MAENIDPLAGKPAPASMLVNVPKLVTAYYELTPDASVASQRVAFGTSGHRGSAFAAAFNETHILAIAQAVCLYRRHAGINGPLFLGMDTHGLSEPAFASALEILAANGVETMIDEHGGYTPTPVISHAILTYNRGRKMVLRMASSLPLRTIRRTRVVSNTIRPMEARRTPRSLVGSKRQPMIFLATNLPGLSVNAAWSARKAASFAPMTMLPAYVAILPQSLILTQYSTASVRPGNDPLGGAAMAIYGTDYRAVQVTRRCEHQVDPTFRFMTVDWDGKFGWTVPRPMRWSG